MNCEKQKTALGVFLAPPLFVTAEPFSVVGSLSYFVFIFILVSLLRHLCRYLSARYYTVRFFSFFSLCLFNRAWTSLVVRSRFVLIPLVMRELGDPYHVQRTALSKGPFSLQPTETGKLYCTLQGMYVRYGTQSLKTRVAQPSSCAPVRVQRTSRPPCCLELQTRQDLPTRTLG